MVKTLLAKKAKVNLSNIYGNTPLHMAVSLGGINMVEELLKHQEINVNAKNKDGCTPLHIAAQGGCTEIANLLLRHKDIKIDIENNEFATPLHMAIQNGHLEIVELLLEKNANITLKNCKQATPLHLAIIYGGSRIVNLLLEKGAPLDKVKGLNVFELAMRAKQLDVLVELLIYWSEKSTSDFWENYIGEVDHNLASLFVNWYTKQENEVLTLHGIRLKDSNEEKILSDQELLERFVEFLKTKPDVIPGEYIEKIKACLEQKNDIEQKKDSKSSKKEQKLNIQPQQSSKNKAIQEDSIYTLLALMNGESPTKTSQQKSKKSKKEIKPTNKEEEIISSKPRIESFFTVFSLTASQGSKKVDAALFKKGMEAINAAIMALNTSGIPFGLKQNGTNHYQLRLDGELPAFAIECFNTHAKPDVISIPHGGNKVWSDHFNSMLSYLVHFMCFVIENGKDDGACMKQLFMFNKQGQLNIDLLKDLYPTIEWDKLD